MHGLVHSMKGYIMRVFSILLALHCVDTYAMDSALLNKAKEIYPNQELRIQLDYPNQATTVPSDINITQFEEQDGRFKAWLLGHPQPITGRVHFRVSIPVLNKPLSPQHIIERDDITFIPVDVSTLKDGVALRGEDVLGKQPKHKILTVMSPIYMRDVSAPAVVKRGEMIRIVYQVGGMSISSTGCAKGDGAIGDRIAFDMQNGRKKQVDAVIADAHTAFIRTHHVT